jgi:hypothetical protein
MITLIKKHAFHIIAIPTIVAAYLFLAYFLFTSFYPYQVLDIQGNAEIMGNTLKPGDPLEYKVSYCKYMNIPGTSYRELVDTVVYNLNSTKSNTPKGCATAIMDAGKVPQVPKGKYHLHIRIVYKINAFREITVPFETNEFTIQ